MAYPKSPAMQFCSNERIKMFIEIILTNLCNNAIHLQTNIGREKYSN